MKDDELFARVDRVLWEDWDPIGVRALGGPDDEYRGYVPSILALLRSGATEAELSERLASLRCLSMGLARNDAHDRRAAHILVTILDGRR
jgi:hypothetical protein